MDELSLFLAKLFGLYFLTGGLIVWFRQKSLMPVVASFGESRAMVLVVALLELFAGLAILIAHPVFESNWRGVITFIGIWLIIESVIFLAGPTSRIRRLVRYFNRPTWYASGALLSVIVGGYLAGVGFGLFQ